MIFISQQGHKTKKRVTIKQIIIIIIKKGWQCKAVRERLTHNQSEDLPAPQYQPIEWKKRKPK